MAAAEAPLVVLDFGSQYTQLIARRARELGVYSVALAGTADASRVLAYNPGAIVLSGGPASVHDTGAPLPSQTLLTRCQQCRIPVLGICYGMQCLVHLLGGQVSVAGTREYGIATVKRTQSISSLLQRNSSTQTVWMSHGDEVVSLPDSLLCIATSTSNGTTVAVEDDDSLRFGLQYHPEVVHTSEGSETLKAFLFDIARMNGSWTLESAMQKQIDSIKAQIGEYSQAVCALSGGVDSAVAASLCHKAIGARLHCVFVDNGLLRKGERAKVENALRDIMGLCVDTIDASDETLKELAGVKEPEEKRQTIGKKFIDVFRRFKEQKEKDSDGNAGPLCFLVQGTLYPDVIESCPPAGSEGRNLSHTIKSHHNVGGLPSELGFELVEPLRDLFKDEVRQLGSLMGVPDWFLRRHPFPGPGLAVRVLGDVTEGPKLHMCREADKIFTEVLEEEEEYDKVWQAFAAVLPVAAVGVQGDQRTRGAAIALRAITSTDGMTADWAPLSHSLLAKASSRICNAVPGVNRVFYDVTSKPPATVELE